MPPPVPDRRATVADAGGAGRRIALNRHRQRELYGCLLGDRVRRLTGALGITQARLARTLGLSPAMLSQLASARRVKIGDPAVLARLQLLDQRCTLAPPRTDGAIEALLEEVARARLQWTGREAPHARPEHHGAGSPEPDGGRVPGPADALRAVAPPARLAAAAATLAPAFPELAAVLRQAAGPSPVAHPAGPPAPRSDDGPRRAPGRPW